MTNDDHLHIDGVSHRYANQDALVSVDIRVAKGEFVTFVGPSGCGKTTLLRIVAGLLSPTEGRIVLNGADITSVPANRRPTNLVFQRPTLFPHLDVRGNIEFGLKLAKLPRTERSIRVQEAIDLLHLGGLERRRPFELSGGQMQRVSLARALVNRPEILLLDEPLSALDMQIRLELEVELRRVHREIGATFLYVTHDQREALALADRVVVFDNGSVAQIDRPEDVYRTPASAFVARFVGDANVVKGEVVSGRDELCENTTMIHGCAIGPTRHPPGHCSVVIRSEALTLVDPGSRHALEGTVVDRVFRGATVAYRVRLAADGQLVRAEASAAAPTRTVGDQVALSCTGEFVVLATTPETESDEEETGD